MNVDVGVPEGVIVAVGVLDGVREGVRVNVGDGVIVNVGVPVTIAQRGAESDNPEGLLVLTYSSYSFTNLTSGICFSEALNGPKRL